MRFILITLSALAALVLVLPGSADAELKVAATVTDLGWIAERVGGDDAEVSVLCPGHQDPHFLPAKPSLSRRLRKADLLVYTGLELEIGWLPLLIEAARNPRIAAGSRGELDCSAAVTRILEIPSGEPDRSRGDIHPLGNPHYLLDPRNGAAVARLMAERMAELDPAAAEGYRRRAEELAGEIGAAVARWEQAAQAFADQAIVVYHQQWEYLLDWLGLELIGAVEHRPGISPSPRHVEQVVLAGREHGAVIVIAAPWNHLDAAQVAADRMEAPMVVLPAAVGALDDTDDYFAVFDRIVIELAAAGAH